MKKLLSLLLCLCILSSALIISAEDPYIEIDPLEYDEYMRGESIYIYGQSNVHVTMGLYYPEHYGSTAKYVLTYSPTELSEGIKLDLGTEEKLWPEGLWTIVFQNGDASEVLEFTLSETVDRSEEPTDDPFDDGMANPNKPNKPSGNGTAQVVLITPEKTKLTLAAGESEKINIQTTASSLSLEIEDKEVLDASLSGKTLTVTALKAGTSTIWVKSSNNYANIKVTVTPAVEKPTEEPTEPPTEEPTEEPTEPPTEEVNPFADLPDNHWAKASILSLYNKGIVNGMDSDTFAPDEFVTRAQFVTMLTKAFELDMKSADSPFNDVSEDAWYFKAVMTAYENAITQGDYAGNFNPDDLVTRQDMATLAHRTAVSVGMILPMTDVIPFADHTSIKDYAIEAVYAMRSASVIKGMTATTFEPLGNATRAQAAHIIANLLALR